MKLPLKPEEDSLQKMNLLINKLRGPNPPSHLHLSNFQISEDTRQKALIVEAPMKQIDETPNSKPFSGQSSKEKQTKSRGSPIKAVETKRGKRISSVKSNSINSNELSGKPRLAAKLSCKNQKLSDSVLCVLLTD